MSGWKKPNCNIPLILLIPGSGKNGTRILCVAKIRHEGNHIYEIPYLGIENGSKIIKKHKFEIEQKDDNFKC